MRVLTFGWDFPPMKNGGLGVACFGLTKELMGQGVEVLFVLPKRQETIGDPTFIFADKEEKVVIRPVVSSLVPYHSTDSCVTSLEYDEVSGKQIYKNRTILEEVHRFAHQASLIATEEQFDLIHAHDWTSYLAGVAAKQATGKPLLLHVHATSFDQAGSQNVDPSMFKIECEAFAVADTIVAVSEYTRQIIINNHKVSPHKVVVVHNGCEGGSPTPVQPTLLDLKTQGKKIVLYHGRITIQKGVDYLVRAAKLVVEVNPDVVFVVSGWGDMTNQIINQVGASKLSNNFIFAGALWDEDRDRMYQAADLVVMPSVSEPFGLVPLEAIIQGTPSLITHQSGVAEVVNHALKVDFWDVEEMANQILAALDYPVLRQQLAKHGREEIESLSWFTAAKKVVKLYQSLLQYN